MLKLTLVRPSSTPQEASPGATLEDVPQDGNVPHNTQPSVPAAPKLRINLGALRPPADSHTSASWSTAPTGSSLPPSNGEEQFILRLPPSLASILTAELTESAFQTPGDLRIHWVSARTAIIHHPRFIKNGYPAILMDSPTIMETLKSGSITVSIASDSTAEDPTELAPPAEFATLTELAPPAASNGPDFFVGQYYKVADVSQVLMVLDLEGAEGAHQRLFARLPVAIQQRLLRALRDPALEGGEPSLTTATSTLHRELASDSDTLATLPWTQLSDGMAAPLRAVRTRRFAARPVHAASVGELEHVEREVERLLRADGQAIDSAFTLLAPDNAILLTSHRGGDEKDGVDTDTDKGKDKDKDNDMDEDEDEDGEATLSGDDAQSEQDDPLDMEDELSDFAAEIEGNLMQDDEEEEEESIPLSDTIILDTVISAPESENARMVRELEARLQEKLRQAESVTNPLIKARIEDVIRQLEDNLNHLRENM